MGEDEYCIVDGKSNNVENTLNTPNTNVNADTATGILENDSSKIVLEEEQRSVTPIELKIQSKLEDHIEKLRSGISYTHAIQPSEILTISLKSTGFDETSLRLFYLNEPVPVNIYILVRDILKQQNLWDVFSKTYETNLKYTKLDDFIELLRIGINYPHKENSSKKILISLKSTGFDEETLRAHYSINPVSHTVDILIKETFEKQGIWSYISQNYLTNSNISKLDEHIEKLRAGVCYTHKMYPAMKTILTLNTEGLDEATLRVYYINETVPDDFDELVETHLIDDFDRLVDTHWTDKNLWNYSCSTLLEDHIKALNVGITYPHRADVDGNLTISLTTPGFDITALKMFYLNKAVPEKIHDLIQEIFEKKGLWEFITKTHDTNFFENSKIDDHIEFIREGIEFHSEDGEETQISNETPGFEEISLRAFSLHKPVPVDIKMLVKQVLKEDE